jgi:hypothetical protein
MRALLRGARRSLGRTSGLRLLLLLNHWRMVTVHAGVVGALRIARSRRA